MTKEEAKLLLIRPIVSSNVVSETKAREIEAYNMAIEALSIEAIQGEWLPRWDEVECSICGEFEKKKSNFCPTCGAKMVERG